VNLDYYTTTHTIAASDENDMMNKALCFTNIVLAGMIIVGAPSHAQSLYRCGSTYQDRPCDGAQKGTKLVGGGGTSTPNGSISDAACVQRGADAQKIVWAREGGAMQDQQLAKATSASQQKLINDVYARRGTSSDIRAAIEADCIAAKERAAQAAALLEASRNGESSSVPAPATGNNQNKPNETDTKAADASRENSARETAQRIIRCNHMKKQLETVVSNQRAGGSAMRMDDLNQQKREFERRMSLEKCD